MSKKKLSKSGSSHIDDIQSDTANISEDAIKENGPNSITEATTDTGKSSESAANENGRAKKERSAKRIDISETSDQVMEIIDDALDENTEDLGLTDEAPAALSSFSLNSILTVIFGIVVLGFAIYGIISSAKSIKSYADAKKANTEKIQLFENLILPLCASDAPTFEGASTINSDVAITAACWDIILSPSSSYVAENGYYTISYLDIDIRINKLFGKGVSYTHTSVGDQEILFEYDEDSGMYTIPAYPKLVYFPTVDKLEQTDTGFIATVSYHPPVTNWTTGKIATDKVMIYTLTGSGITYSITALEVGEIVNTQEL